MKLLVSVRSEEEALAAADAGADFIDLKEPSAGALGGLPAATIRGILARLGERPGELSRPPVSATIGDFPAGDIDAILSRVREVHDCGVDHVKVGVERGPDAPALLHALAGLGLPLIPVLIADDGIDAGLVAGAAAGSFPAVMLDTADKRSGTLLDIVPEAQLRAFIATVRGAGAAAGLAGALRLVDVPRLLSLDPDFAGFRSAVCAPSPAGRAGPLDPARIRRLRAVADGRLGPSVLQSAIVQPTIVQPGSVLHVDPA